MLLPQRLFIVSVVLALLGQPQAAGQASEGAGDFAFLEPWFDTQPDDRRKLAERGVVVRVLPADGREIGVVAACAVTMSPAGFVDRIRAMGGAQHTEVVAGRFSEPPALADLARLTLDVGDLDRVGRCRWGDCRLNLAQHEMIAVQRALTANGDSAEAQQAFRRVVLDRVARYRAGGLASLPEYQDQREPVHPDAIFSDLLLHSPYLGARLPDVAAHLGRLPFGANGAAESFLQWSKVMINDKAVVTATHISIFRPPAGPAVPAVIVAGKQIYASRYMNGELTLTMLFGTGSPGYLVHVNRSHLDALGGRFGGLKRAVLETAIKSEAADVLARLRGRLERAD